MKKESAEDNTKDFITSPFLVASVCIFFVCLWLLGLGCLFVGWFWLVFFWGGRGGSSCGLAGGGGFASSEKHLPYFRGVNNPIITSAFCHELAGLRPS